MTSLSISKKTVLKQVVTTIIAVAVAVGLPQLLHVAGRAAGVDTKLGEILLPMHIPVLLAGFLGGPITGLVAGIISPILSYALSGMPTQIMLPYILIEVVTYGFAAGMFKNANMNVALKVLACQMAGRIVRAIAILICGTVSSTVIWNSVKVGAIGIVLQLILVPLILYRVEGKKSAE